MAAKKMTLAFQASDKLNPRLLQVAAELPGGRNHATLQGLQGLGMLENEQGLQGLQGLARGPGACEGSAGSELGSVV